MKYKYIILDFGKVITGPLNEMWDFTPKFVELIDKYWGKHSFLSI